MAELKKEDYEESACLLCMKKSGAPLQKVPIDRVIQKLDEYLSGNDEESALRHLTYWAAEAEEGRDFRSLVTILNERMGLERKMGHEAEAFDASRKALALVKALGMEGTRTAGTVQLNAATVCEAFGQPKEAVALYESARENLEKSLPADDALLGGLYNNEGLAYAALKEDTRARACFDKALEIMLKAQDGLAQAAITYLNLADLEEALHGPEAAEKRIADLLDKAEACILSEQNTKDGEYAYACEKCAPVFGYYGRFLTEAALHRQAEEIYAGNRTSQRIL